MTDEKLKERIKMMGSIISLTKNTISKLEGFIGTKYELRHLADFMEETREWLKDAEKIPYESLSDEEFKKVFLHADAVCGFADIERMRCEAREACDSENNFQSLDELIMEKRLECERERKMEIKQKVSGGISKKPLLSAFDAIRKKTSDADEDADDDGT